ncbi:hypothetical protein JL722_3786 [Aureococcus anophagefferens]|nr:hypothetical protein JL722_3786 [Aureococcus anophagefferens]
MASQPGTPGSPKRPKSRPGSTSKLRTRPDSPEPIDFSRLEQFDNQDVLAFVTEMPARKRLDPDSIFPREEAAPRPKRYDRPLVGTPYKDPKAKKPPVLWTSGLEGAGDSTELRRGFAYKEVEDVWHPVETFWHDWARMRPKQQSHVHLEESNVRDGDLAILAATNPTVNYLNLRGNPLLSHHGVEKLQHLDRCTHLDLSHCAGVEDKAMEHLRRHTKYLRVLNLSHTNVGDAGIHSFLAGIKLLEELYMRQCPKMTDKGLVEISRQIKLRQVIKVLDLRETLGFSNDALLLLMAEGGGGLHELNLRGCRQIDSLGLLGLRRDVGTLEMRRLDIGGLPHVISGSTLLGGFAGGCRRLRELRLTGLKDAVDDNALQAFAKAAEDSVHGHAPLEVLDLSLCPQISALGLRPFLRAVADALRDLDVSFCPLLDDAFCGALAPCLQLDRLRAVDTPLISDRGIATWVKGPKVEVDHYAGPAHERIVKRREGEPEPKRTRLALKELILEAALTGSVDTSARCRVPRYSERGIRSLCRTCGATIAKLDVDGAPRVDAAAIATVAKFCKNLARLGVDSCARVTDLGLVAVATSCVFLERLRAAGCGGDRHPITSKTAEAIGRNCPRATTLDLSRSEVGRSGLLAIAAGCTLLETLKVNKCEYVDDVAVDAILAGCPKLKALHLATCDLVSSACVRRVGLAHHLEVLDLSGAARGRGLGDRELGRATRALPFGKKEFDGRRCGVVPVAPAVRKFVAQQMRCREAYRAATVIETRHRYKAAGRYYVVFRAARLYEGHGVLRARHPALHPGPQGRAPGRRLAQKRTAAADRAYRGALLDDLAIDAAQLLKRRKKGLRPIFPSFRRLTLALAFFTFDAYRDYDLWLEVNATFLARWVRKTLARCWRETKYFAALAIQNLGRRRLGGNALERKRREAIARAAKLALEAKIEEALRRQRWEADKLRKDQEQLEREAEERKRRESAMMTALFMKAREESPFETRKRLRRHRNKHACKIQGALRAHLARNVVKAAKKRITWIMKAFERFGDPKTLLLDRAKALRVIQQAIRNRVRRWRAVKYWRDRKEHRYATQIQSRFRLRSARRATLARHRAFNRACFIICHVWGRRKARIQYREIQRKLKQRADEDALQHKVELLRRKNDRAVKKTITAVKETAKRAWNASMGASEADLVRRGYDLPEIRKDPPHVRLYDLLKDGKSGQQREEESEQVENSVLNLQSRSIKPRGVVDIMITVGRQELASQNEKQDYNKSIKQPVFERIKKDLSTNKSRIYVWYCMGSGPRVLTQFRVRRAPPNHKNKAANESRIFGAYVAGTVIRGHEKLNVEIHGDAGIFAASPRRPST